MQWKDHFRELEKMRSSTSSSEKNPRQRSTNSGSIKHKMKELAAQGRYGDTKLAKIGPRTAKTLDKLIHDGHKQINPKTGLREYPPKTSGAGAGGGGSSLFSSSSRSSSGTSSTQRQAATGTATRTPTVPVHAAPKTTAVAKVRAKTRGNAKARARARANPSAPGGGGSSSSSAPPLAASGAMTTSASSSSSSGVGGGSGSGVGGGRGAGATPGAGQQSGLYRPGQGPSSSSAAPGAGRGDRVTPASTSSSSSSSSSGSGRDKYKDRSRSPSPSFKDFVSQDFKENHLFHIPTKFEAMGIGDEIHRQQAIKIADRRLEAHKKLLAYNQQKAEQYKQHHSKTLTNTMIGVNGRSAKDLEEFIKRADTQKKFKDIPKDITSAREATHNFHHEGFKSENPSLAYQIKVTDTPIKKNKHGKPKEYTRTISKRELLNTLTFKPTTNRSGTLSRKQKKESLLVPGHYVEST